jgi:hypothetical protein
MKKNNKDQTIDTLSEIYSEIIKDRIKDIVIEIVQDERIQAIIWAGKLEIADDASIARQALEIAIQEVCSDPKTYEDLSYFPWGEDE